MTPTTITRQQAIPLILAAIENQTLAATDDKVGAAYAWPKGWSSNGDLPTEQAQALADAGAPMCYCAIGVVIGPKNALDLQFSKGTTYALAYSLIARGDLIVPEDEVEWFVALQATHDSWAGAPHNERKRATFMDHLK